MTSVEPLLTPIRTRLEAATGGPWVAEYSGEQGDCVIPHDAQSTREAVAVTHLYHRTADAEFIAHARDDVPRLLAAIEAVAKIHGPFDALMNPGRYERIVKVCTGCGTDDGNWQRWPCPTVKAINDALEGEGK